jgi:hypothetical protein
VNWEALTAISTAATALVILITAIYAARQVRAMNEQSKAMSAHLDHLRRATQLSGIMAIFDEWQSPQLRDSYNFVMTEFTERMKDEQFHAEAVTRSPSVEVHKELAVLRDGERIGTLVKTGLLDSDALFEYAGLYMYEIWQRMEPLVREQRLRLGNNDLWENFEYLALGARRFVETRRQTHRA